MSGTVLLIFEIIGTISFAVSGAVTALQKKMDIFGVVILGLSTAVGGGVVRDLILGQTPPATFQNPLYALVAVATAVVVFIPAVRRLFDRYHRLYEVVLLVMDSLGLGVFTVVGIRTAYAVSHEYGLFLLIFVGVVTGIGGGVMRDVLAGNTPYIFVKHFYATASLIGAFVCVGCWQFFGETWAMVCGSAVIVLLRLLAAHYHWSLPKAE